MSLVNYHTFYQQYYPLLVRTLTAIARDATWAEDVAQDSMLAAHNKWEDLLTYARPDSWLFKVAIRQLRRTEAKNRRESPWPDDLIADLGHLRYAASNDQWIGDHLDVLTAILTLPRRQAEVIALHYLADYTLQEAAVILGVSASAAKTHKRRALEALKRQQSAGNCISSDQPERRETGR